MSLHITVIKYEIVFGVYMFKCIRNPDANHKMGNLPQKFILIISIFSSDLHQVWDEADYVVPPAENGAFFVTTNVVITPNQTWGECPEVGDNFSVRIYKLQKVQKYTNLNYKTKFKSTKQTYIYTTTQQYHQ